MQAAGIVIRTDSSQLLSLGIMIPVLRYISRDRVSVEFCRNTPSGLFLWRSSKNEPTRHGLEPPFS